MKSGGDDTKSIERRFAISTLRSSDGLSWKCILASRLASARVKEPGIRTPEIHSGSVRLLNKATIFRWKARV